MTLQQLKYALAIAETGSMNKAAERLYVSQPSLTASVQELEKEAGIQIFNRSGRGVTLTNDGTEFLRYAQQVVGQFDVLAEKYISKGNVKKKFGVSAQHYSFAVKAFVEMVKRFDHMHHFLLFMKMGKLLMRVSRHKDPLVFHDPSEKNAARIIPAAFSFVQ